MFRRFGILRSTKVIPFGDGKKEIILVGIIRDRVFGKDTIEEALRVVDTMSVKRGNSLEVLVGINDHEYKLLTESSQKPARGKGKFMAPLFSLCLQNQISIRNMGRSLTAVSSRVSIISMKSPIEFYKLLWLLATKSSSVFRSDQIRPFLRSRIPSYVSGYFDEAGECMALKIIERVRASGNDSYVVVLPFEHSLSVEEGITSKGKIDSDTIRSRISHLEEDDLGLWIPVILLYMCFPIALIFKFVTYVGNVQLKELSNYKTEGIVLGTWVRDKSRD